MKKLKENIKVFLFYLNVFYSALENEYFFVDPDLKLTKVAPEGWKEEPKKKNKATVNFTLFFRIKFFMDDVSLIQWVHRVSVFLFLTLWFTDTELFDLISDSVFFIIKNSFNIIY